MRKRWVLILLITAILLFQALYVSNTAKGEKYKDNSYIIKELLSQLPKDSKNSLKIKEYGNSIYAIYTEGRKHNSYISIYTNSWSTPKFVGGDYPSFIVNKNGIFVASSINHHPYLYYYTGEWKHIKLSMQYSILTNISSENGKILILWSSNNSVWASIWDGKRVKNVEIAETHYPVREIQIEGHSINIKLESLHYWIYQRYTSLNMNNWYMMSKTFQRKYEDTINADSIPKTTYTAKWTFMVYMDGDNSLSDATMDDLGEMESGYMDTKYVNVIVLWDRNGNGDTKLIKIKHNGYESLSVPWMSSEMNMGNPNTLVNFVTWVVKTYPAEHYFLDLWDHGGDYAGAMWDETSSSHLSLKSLHYAAEKIKEETGGVDIWGYDACLMDTGADNYEVRNATSIILASEHTEGNDGWDYHALLYGLTSNPNMTAEQYAGYFVKHVDDENMHLSISTMAAINTTTLEFFMNSYNQLAQAIRKKAGTNNSQIKKAFQYAVSADSKYWSSGKDIGDIAKELLKYVNDENISFWAERLLENASNSVIAYYDSDTNGRKIMMAETINPSQVSSFSIFNDYQWDEMLNQVYTLGKDDNNNAPSCEFNTPKDITLTQGGTAKIYGKAWDDNSIKYVQIKIDKGEWMMIGNNTQWNYKINTTTLSVGTHYIFARAYDGDLYSQNKFIILHIFPPLLPDLEISNEDVRVNDTSIIEGEHINIAFKVRNLGNIDAQNVSISVYIDFPYSQYLISNITMDNIPSNSIKWGSVVWNTSGIKGEHRIIVWIDKDNRIREVNEKNNNASIQVIIHYPPSPPSMLTAKIGMELITLSWLPPEDDGMLPILGYRIYRGVQPSNISLMYEFRGNRTHFYDYNITPGVKYYYAVTAINEAGESEMSKIISAFADNIKPWIKITSPLNNSILNISHLKIMWEGNDSQSGLNHFEIKMDNGSWINLGTETEYDLKIDDGKHRVLVKAIDNAGNWNISSLNIMIDTTPPSLKIISPEDNAILNESTIELKINASDSLSGLKDVYFKIDNSQWEIIRDNIAYIQVTDGFHKISVEAYDLGGNKECGEISITIDTTPPKIYSINPPNGSIINIKYEKFRIEWEVVDNLGIAYFAIKVDNSNWKILGMNESFVVNNPQQKNYTVLIKAVDIAGNSEIKKVLIKCIIDTDRDGIPDSQDAFPENPKEWKDSDGDGLGDNEDFIPDFNNYLLYTLIAVTIAIATISMFISKRKFRER